MSQSSIESEWAHARIRELEQQIKDMELKQVQVMAEADKKLAAKNDELHQLMVKLDHNEKLNKQFRERLVALTVPLAIPGEDPSLVTQSEPYQILLQDSNAKDEQILLLHAVQADNENLILQLEVKVQELGSKSVKADKKLAAKDDELHHLKLKLDRNEKLNKQLRERIMALTVPSAMCGEGSEVKPKATTSLITQSEPYQILLQDSNAKDEQIRQLHAVRADNENLKLQLEVKVQELDSKSVEADEKLAAKDDELHHLKLKLDRNQKLNKQLHERISALTVPLATCGEGSEVKPKATTCLITQSEPYQILLQDSNAKDEQIRQLHAVRADNENLKLQLEVKVQELDSKSVEADGKLAAKDDELHHLKVKLDHYEKLNKQLRERISALTVPLATCGEGSEVKPKATTCLITQSEPYQILLQDSNAKDEQIRQLHAVRADNENLKLQLEVKVQELDSKSVEADGKLAAKDDELHHLKVKLDHYEKLNKQLRERISALTVPLATCGEGSEVKPKATTCLITQSEPYQILLQDSNAKDEQIRQSHAVRADNENLKL